MEIAFLGDSFLFDNSTGVNGTQVQMYNLAKAFADRGLGIHYVSLTKNEKQDSENVEGIEIHWIKSNFEIFSWLKEVSDFRKVLNSIKPDVVYQRGRSYLTYVGGAWAEKNNKYFVWGSNGEDSCDFWKGILRLRKSKRPLWRKLILYPYFGIQDVLIHRGIRKANCVINQTDYQRARLLKNYGKKGIIIPSYFRLGHSNTNEKRSKHCLWVGNLSPNKQPEIFLRLAQHCKALADWKFILVGGTKDERYWSYLVKESVLSANVAMTGNVPFNQMDTYFADASLFVNTSNMEADGISNAMIQAWLHGVPVLSLNHDPNDWITGKRLGFCAKGDLKAFLSTGYRMLQDVDALEEMGKSCAEFAKNTFASDKIMDHYVEILRQLSKNENLLCNELSLQ